MEAKNRAALSITGLAGAISLGLFLKKYIAQTSQSENVSGVVQRMKHFEQKLYADGKMRAEKVEEIKQEIDRQI